MLILGVVALGLSLLNAIVVQVVVFKRYPDLWTKLAPPGRLPGFLAVLYRIGKIGGGGAFRWPEFPEDSRLRAAWISAGILGDAAAVILLVGAFFRWL